MKDLIGKAILDHLTGNAPGVLMTETSISEPDELPIDYFFRPLSEMPKLEQRALELACGKVLDVGCGAGSHALYLQNDRKLDVTAIDISPRSIEACRLRGLNQVENIDLLDKTGTFDTILMLMNGTGIFGSLAKAESYLEHLKKLLSPGGQILIDSSDLIYMFDEDEDGGRWIDFTKGEYYGELTFDVYYKGEAETFDWLYLDFDTLMTLAAAFGFHCEKVLDGESYDYLAKLTLA